MDIKRKRIGVEPLPIDPDNSVEDVSKYSLDSYALQQKTDALTIRKLDLAARIFKEEANSLDVFATASEAALFMLLNKKVSCFGFTVSFIKTKKLVDTLSEIKKHKTVVAASYRP